MKKTLLGIVLLLLSVQILSAQNKHFTGSWTKSGTTYLFDFELNLRHTDGNRVQGYFTWQVKSSDDKNSFSIAHYKNRIGSYAKEYVKGTYYPGKREYMLQGYKKEDPNQIISLDQYKISIDENGDLGGKSKTMGSWEGIINGKDLYLITM